MVRRIMVAALASAALALPGAALAGPGKSKAAKAERVASKAAAKSARAVQKAALKSDRSASRAAAKAQRSASKAEARSVLRGSNVVAGPLTGLDPGDLVYGTVNGSFQQVGSVERIVPSVDGRVRNVLVRTVDGRILPLAPGSLTLDSASGEWTAVSLRPNANRRRN
ncbi:MAG TPA: hypothetical protein VFK58_08720 [Sphingomicrobium sp.]|nr:hypothetical protein [Sphingomicrobium sp.]